MMESLASLDYILHKSASGCLWLALIHCFRHGEISFSKLAERTYLNIETEQMGNFYCHKLKLAEVNSIETVVGLFGSQR